MTTLFIKYFKINKITINNLLLKKKIKNKSSYNSNNYII